MNRRILLIEDEPLSQDIITSLLRGQGYAVDVATDGFAALDRARSVSYDAALVDYHLPEMDGYALGRLLREQHPADGAGPVLIGLTADHNGLAARRGSDAVFRAILPKPVKPADLFSAIERLCEAARPAPAPALGAAEARPGDIRQAAAALWRSHGLRWPPKVFASPQPSAEQAAALALCFELVEAEAAQGVVLLERHGVNQALRSAMRGESLPLPIVGLSADHADICDCLFRVDDPTSWKALAEALGAKTSAAADIPRSPPPVREAGLRTLASAALAPPAEQPARLLEPCADPAAAGSSAREIRALLLGGVRAPLDRLRQHLSVQQRRPGPDGQRDGAIDPIEELDSMLLITGVIADALNTSMSRATEASVFDPSELAGNALAMIRDSLPPGFARLSCRSAAGLPPLLRGDAHRLSQALLTLLDDACACAEPVALTLRIDFDAERGALTLVLSQAGEPADAGAEHGVVALLRRLRLTMLGRLVRLMGGSLVREPGETRLSVPASPEAQPSHIDDGETGGACEPARILLIDDGATSGQLMTLLLARKGHHICRVGDAEAALVASREARPDLVIFDLPNGEAALQGSLDAVRQFRTARAEAPALVLANGLSSADEARLRDWGVARLLAKPFAPEALDKAVAACRVRPAAPPRPTAEIVDAAVRDALTQALGVATVERLSSQLLAQIEGLLATPALSDEAEARLVELSGCACVLGLAELAAFCAKPTDIGAIGSALQRLRERLDAPRRSAA